LDEDRTGNGNGTEEDENEEVGNTQIGQGIAPPRVGQSEYDGRHTDSYDRQPSAEHEIHAAKDGQGKRDSRGPAHGGGRYQPLGHHAPRTQTVLAIGAFLMVSYVIVEVGGHLDQERPNQRQCCRKWVEPPTSNSDTDTKQDRTHSRPQRLGAGRFYPYGERICHVKGGTGISRSPVYAFR